MEWCRHGLISIALLLFWAARGDAQDVVLEPVVEKEAVSRTLTRLDYTHGRVFIDRDGPSYRITITGGFTLSYGNHTLEAENAVLWLERAALIDPPSEAKGIDSEATLETDREKLSIDENLKDKTQPFLGDLIERIYAEGFLRYENGLEVIEADRAYFNLKNHTGLLLSAVIRAPIPVVPPVSIVIRAGQLEQLSESAYRAYDTSLTTSSHGDPHYFLRSTVVSFERLDQSAKPRIRAEGNSFVLADQMLTPLPTANYALGEDAPIPIKSIAVGRSSDFGVFFLSRWGQDIDDFGRGVNELVGIEGEFDGNWFIDLNAYSRRGVGLGGGLEWRTKNVYEGLLETFYIDDRKEVDGDGTAVENNDRGRVHLLNRAFLSEGLRLDTELSYISEKHFLDEYFEREAKTEKEQETYAYLRKLWTQEGFTLLSRHRINDFDTQTEYLPRAAFRSLGREVAVLSEENGIGLYHSNFSEVSHVRRLPSDQLSGTPQDFSSERLLRADTVDRFDLPVQVDRYTITPFYENRFSWFERSVERGNHGTNRFVGAGGARVTTQFHRTFDVGDDSLGLYGLRHIVIPEVQYRNTFAINSPSNELIPIDNIENEDRLEAFLFRLDQRFQTHQTKDPNSEVFDFLSLELEQPVFPNENRDNGGRTLGFLFFESFLRTKLDVYPLKDLALLTRAEWDWDAQGFDTTQFALSSEVAMGWRARASFRSVRGAFNTLTLGSIYRITPKWEFDVLEQRDLRDGVLLERRFGIRRFGNDWVVGLYLSVDEGENNRSISLSLSPTFLYRDPRGSGIGPYGEPFFDPDLNL